MASPSSATTAKTYPVSVFCDEAGNNNLRFDTLALLAIGKEAGFEGLSIKNLAQEYMKRAAVEDPDLDSSLKIDSSMGIFLAMALSPSLTREERESVVQSLQSQGYDAQCRELEQAE
jgi:hypothetical protein